jgi:hypothetical protein
MTWVFRRPSAAPYLAARGLTSTPPFTLAPTGVFTGSADSVAYAVTPQDASGAYARSAAAASVAFMVTPQNSSAVKSRPDGIADFVAYLVTPQDAYGTISWNIQLRGIQETTLQCVGRAR